MLQRYQDTVAGEVARIGGHLAQFLGDGVVAYFGWPRAHEDDAERAVRAALAVVSAAGRLTTPGGEPLVSRVGIATGTVVVGDLVGGGRAREESAVGSTPNLAARLQALAPPGGIVLSDATRRLLGGIFELAPIDDVELKGFDERITAWRVIGEAVRRGRFEARQGANLGRMIGRDQELALLRQRWTEAQGGEGQAVLLVGEAGIGKSRLMRGLRDAIADGPHAEVRWQGSPFYTDTPFWPVIQDLVDGQTPPDLTMLERRLAESGVDLAAAVPLLAAQIGVSTDGRYAELELVAEAQRPRLMSTLLDYLVGLAARKPLLLILEDAHWADATTLELTQLLLDRIADVPMLVVITSRPEGVPPLQTQGHMTSLTLSGLGRGAIAEIVAHLMPNRDVPQTLLDTIVTPHRWRAVVRRGSQ